MDYQAYKKEFLESLRNDSAINGTDTEDEFLNRTLSLLVDYDEVNDPVRFGMGDKRGRGNRLMRADGYCFDETDHSLILFISDFQDSENAANLTRSRVDELYWRLYYFLDEVCNGRMEDYFDDSDDILRVARMFRKRMTCNIDDPQLILKIKFYVLTNKELDTALLDANLLETTIRKKKGVAKKTRTTKKIKKADFNGKPLEINLWYPERFYEMEMTNSNEPVVIDIPKDFSEVGVHGIPCIKGDIGENLGYEAYVAIIPGKLLAEIYIAYGSKVLEGNVRAFLGTSGSKSVNNGIKRTINNDATKFFTYNNGIATTAKGVEIENINGQNLITKIVDFQIINGGQTTATLADAVLKKTNVELEGIYVPMKLTVIEDRETENEDGVRFYDEMVQAIARYANSQNKVTAADLFSNDPFHIWMEKMSKKCLAPPARYTIPTGWYYERSRKKYQQEQVKLELPGYHQYWNYANRRGYSGTAIFTKREPLSAAYGIGIAEHDKEGRVITLEFDEYYFVTVYTPNSQSELRRLEYRMKWEEDFLAYLLKLQEKKPVICCGDLNVAHQEIDLKNPKTNRKNAGFTDEERACFSRALESGFIDTFRYFYPDKEGVYSWWSYRFRAREKNAGWRIDYFLVSPSLKEKLQDAKIHGEIMGSDHCPVELDIDL